MADVPAVRGGSEVGSRIVAARMKAGVHVRPEKLQLRIPSLRLIHKVVSRQQVDDGWVPGCYVYRDVVFKDGVEVVFLSAWEIRLYDQADPQGKMHTLCASDDGLVPLEQIVNPPSKVCATCPMGQWVDGDEIDSRTGRKRRVPPECDEGFGLLGVIPQLQDAPFWFVCKGTLQRVAAAFISAFQTDPVAGALHDWRVLLQSEPATSRRMSWYLPIFTVVPSQSGDSERYGKLFEQAKDVRWLPFLGGAGAGGEAEPSEPKDVTPPSQDAAWPSDDDIPF